MKQVIVITGALSGFGALAARALARAGHTVYASMRETTGRNALQGKAVETYAADAEAAMQAILAENGRLRGHSQCRTHGFRSRRSLHPGTVRATL
jgi:NAD(P)-dependent dehydrogenase (short-subunit alcohol dehydrogenase family)